jgi:hypothetical protein
VSRYAANPLTVVALSPDHSDITRFRPWSPIVTGNHWIVPNKKNPKVTQAPLTFLIRQRAFQDPPGGELLHVKIFMNDGPNLLT